MKYRMIILFFFIVVTSCNEKFNERIITNNDISVNWYEASRSFTSTLDFIAVTKGDSTKEIMKAEVNGIYDIFIEHDTIVVRTRPQWPVYDVKENVFNYHVTRRFITEYQFAKKYNPSYAEGFRDTTEFPR